MSVKLKNLIFRFKISLRPELVFQITFWDQSSADKLQKGGRDNEETLLEYLSSEGVNFKMMGALISVYKEQQEPHSPF